MSIMGTGKLFFEKLEEDMGDLVRSGGLPDNPQETPAAGRKTGTCRESAADKPPEPNRQAIRRVPRQCFEPFLSKS